MTPPQKGYYVQGDITNPGSVTVNYVSGERKGNMWARPRQFTGWASLAYSEVLALAKLDWYAGTEYEWTYYADLPTGVVPPKPAKPNAR